MSSRPASRPQPARPQDRAAKTPERFAECDRLNHAPAAQAELLGGAAQPLAQHARAVGVVDPQRGRTRESLGQAGQRRDAAGRAEDAVGHLEKAVTSAPGSTDLFGLLGGALKKAGRTEDAVGAYEQAITLEPGLADTHYNLGNALRDLGRSQDAVAFYRRAVELNPGFADALNNMGRVMADLGEHDDAISSFNSACAITPEDAWIHSNLGNVYRGLGRFEDAIDAHRRAIALDPESIKYRSNLGAALVDIGLTEEAADEFRRALEAVPGDPGFLRGLGNARVDQGCIEDAKAAYAEALAEEPDNPMTHYLLGRALLLDGDFDPGWREFAWRFRVASLGMRDPDILPQAPWQGEDVTGKTILVWGEQGVGDEVLFSGQIPDLLMQGANVIMECDPRLTPLYERSFDGVRCIAKTDPPSEGARSPHIDFQIPSGNLGRWLRPGLDSFPAHDGYLRPDEKQRDALRQRYLDGDDVLLVGIAWNSKNDKFGDLKSLSLNELRPLAEVPGIKLVDLQYGDTVRERAAFKMETGHSVLHDDDIDQMAALDGFAAQVAALDLVVTISNTTAHVAGALGIPTWVLLHTAPLSCWMMDREDSPWYPTVQLFRQARPGEWGDVIDRIAERLVNL